MDNQRFEEIKQHYADYGGLHSEAIQELIVEVERLQAVNEQSLEALELVHACGPKAWHRENHAVGSKIRAAIAKGEAGNG